MTLALTDEQLSELAQSVQVPVASVEPEPAPAEPATKVSAQEPSVLDKLLTATAENATLKAANEKLSADLAKSGEQIDQLLTLGRQQVKTLGLHFGVQASAVDSMDASAILAEYTRLSAMFVQKFPAGRVAAPMTEKEPEKATLDPLYVATLKAAKTR